MSAELHSRYQVLGSLGKGGMGEVLKARDRQLKRVVAMKRLLPGSLGDEEARARFLREARLAAQLNHPHIATIYDIFDADGQTFIVMEYVEGETLRERIQRGPLPLEDALDLGAQIAGALAAAHKQGVIHRDIKSENIKVTPEGSVKVLDFGLAKRVQALDATTEETVPAESVWLTQPGFAAGTPGYTAPEQWRGGRVDGRADIFSFGVVLYEMITGRTPFQGRSVIERITATMHDEPDPLTKYARVPARLERIVRKALAKHPDQRTQSMEQLWQELESLKRQPIPSGEASTVVAEPAAATLAARYRILTELGAGGMGKVYQARDLKLDRLVAIKQLRQDALGDATATTRFLREASLLAQLNHPNIATVHDIIEEKGQIFIVMEFIEGERLLDSIKRRPLPPNEAYQVALEVAEALAEAHARRIIHRDIKSANIMITATGHAKVLDFGLAKRISPSHLSQTGETQTMAAELTGTRVTFGTPKYMSPEQRLTADVDERSDIFSYGVVLCEMLVGPFPLMGETVAEILAADPAPWPAPLDRIQSHWRPIVKTCLVKDPRQRYQTVAELITDLKQLKDLAVVPPTEPATAALQRPPVEAVAEPKVFPTLMLSAVGLAPALFLMHLASEYAGRQRGGVFLLLAFLLPGLLFFLWRLSARRSDRLRQLASGVHPRTLAFVYLNLGLVLLAAIAFFDFLGWQSWGDWRYTINREPPSSEIVLVAIDETTKNQFQQQGANIRERRDLMKLRQFHPQVLQNLIQAGKPAAIAFDMFFSDASEYDDAFAAALRRVKAEGVPVVIGQYFDVQKQGFLETTPKIRDALIDDNGRLPVGHPIVLEGLKDEVVRVVPLVIRRNTAEPPLIKWREYPSISLLMLTGGVYDRRHMLVPGEAFKIRGDLTVPVDKSIRYVKGLPGGEYEYENLLVNFPSEKFQKISYFDVWSGNIASNQFDRKVVLIGMEYEPFEEYKRVPIGEQKWSPYKIHASALSTMLRRSFIRRVSGWPGFLALLLASTLIFALAIKLPARSWMLPLVTVGIWLALLATAYVLFKGFRLWLDTGYAMFATGATGVLTYLKR